MRYIAIVLLLCALISFGVWFGLCWARASNQSTKYLDSQYLKFTKKAQKASRKNKQIAEYYIEQADRYHAMLQQRNQLRDGVDQFINRLNGPPK